jgi:diguanylate cyclase (GGDEF)-like protein
MQPAPTPPHDVARDPILDGRDSLRLVRLRLGLTLIAVAILPVLALAPLVRAIAEEARVAHHSQLDADATSVGAGVEAALAAIRATGANLLANERVRLAAAADATAEARTAADYELERVVTEPVSGWILVDAAGVHAVGGDLPDPLVAAVAARPAPPAGTTDAVDVFADLEGIDTTLGVPVLGADPTAARVVAVVDPDDLVAVAAPGFDTPGGTVSLVSANRLVLGAVRAPFDAMALPGQILDLATQAAQDSDGRRMLATGDAEMSVVVAAPIPVTVFPVSALAALGGLLLGLFGFTWWMARQILRPAAQLEASRSRLRELYESAREAALVDSLTGLGNHRAFQEALARMVEGSARYHTPFALVLLDVDEFKTINDARGHAVGDQLLAQIGDLIRLAIRQTDFGFRVGGDEFAILLPHADAESAVRVTTRLLRRCLDARVSGRYQAPISFSAGVTSCPELGTTRLELTAQADAALYRGKRTGRTVVTLYDARVDHGHVDEGMRAELSSAISAVIETNALTAVYQPIVELATGRVLGYEGLVRVPRESTFANTGALFDAAEVAGRVADLDRAALEAVLRDAASIAPDKSISLNLSPRTMESIDFSGAALLGILRRHDVRPDRVILELTERQAVRDIDRLKEAVRVAREAGVRMAADDVGAGNAGLRLLSQLPFDVIKIDLSLVQEGARQDQTLSVLTSLVEMAARWGAMTIAEGVETAAQLRTIRRLGISAAQGYLLGRPGPDRDLTWIDLDALSADDGLRNRGAFGAPAATTPVGGFDPGAGADGQGFAEGGLSPLRRRAMAFRNTSRVSNE